MAWYLVLPCMDTRILFHKCHDTPLAPLPLVERIKGIKVTVKHSFNNTICDVSTHHQHRQGSMTPHTLPDFVCQERDYTVCETHNSILEVIWSWYGYTNCNNCSSKKVYLMMNIKEMRSGANLHIP